MGTQETAGRQDDGSLDTLNGEPAEVYAELVAALADGFVPCLIMTGLVIVVATYALSEIDSLALVAAASLCVLALLARTALFVFHRRSLSTQRQTNLAEVDRYEALHAASSIVVGGSVGLFTTTIFSLPNLALHLTATSLLFGYCAGIINRVSARPRIAVAALTTAGLPAIAATAATGTKAHVIVSLVFAGFLGGALQSVSYVYETMRRGVFLRLQMATLAGRDQLTGLLNRFGLYKTADALRGSAEAVAVHVFDLDGFKSVNDRFGHAGGDRLLVALAERLRAIVPEGTVVARIGGDEFVLVQLGVATPVKVRHLADTVHLHLTRPYDVGGGEMVSVGLSLGTAGGRLSQTRLDDLIRQADEASYSVKRQGGGVGNEAVVLAPPESHPPELLRSRTA